VTVFHLCSTAIPFDTPENLNGFFFAPEIQSEAEQHEVSGYIRRALGLLLLGLHMHDLRYERSGRQKIAACTVRNTEMLYSGHEFIF
jgi:hypothetical protein